MICDIAKTETFQTIKASIGSWEKRFEKADDWFKQNKNQIHISRQEAINLYMLGLDVVSIQFKNKR